MFSRGDIICSQAGSIFFARNSQQASPHIFAKLWVLQLTKISPTFQELFICDYALLHKDRASLLP